MDPPTPQTPESLTPRTPINPSGLSVAPIAGGHSTPFQVDLTFDTFQSLTCNGRHHLVSCHSLRHVILFHLMTIDMELYTLLRAMSWHDLSHDMG